MSSVSLRNKLENTDTKNLVQQIVQLHGKIKVDNYVIRFNGECRKETCIYCMYIENNTSTIKAKNGGYVHICDWL